MPESTGWNEVAGPAADADIARMRDEVDRCMADADVGPLLLRIEAEQRRASTLEELVEQLRDLLAEFADAGAEMRNLVGRADRLMGGES